MSHLPAAPLAAPVTAPENSTLPTSVAPPFVDPAGRNAIAVAGTLAVAVAGLLLFAAAILFHPGWIIPAAEIGVVAVFAALFAATR